MANKEDVKWPWTDEEGKEFFRLYRKWEQGKATRAEKNRIDDLSAKISSEFMRFYLKMISYL
jgi:hypothetical protein